MNDVAAELTNSRIIAAYRERTPGSADLAKEANELFPSGITHDARNVDPYGVFIARAQGPHKWDVDGNRYIDYFGGHGALLLGHAHPAVVEAVQAQVTRGTHWGSSHEAEVRWAEEGRVGMEFRDPIEPRAYEAMLNIIPPRQTAW